MPAARRGAREFHCRPGWLGSALVTFTTEDVTGAGAVTRGGLDLASLFAGAGGLFLHVSFELPRSGCWERVAGEMRVVISWCLGLACDHL